MEVCMIRKSYSATEKNVMTTTQPIWRTQLMSCIINTSARKSTASIDEFMASSFVTKVPMDGWYGLFFGRTQPSHPTTITHATARRSKRRYVMSMIPSETNTAATTSTGTTTTNTGDDRSVSFPLPLLHEMSALEHHPSSLSSRVSRQNQHHAVSPDCNSINSSSCTLPLDNINTGKLIYCTSECTVVVHSHGEEDEEEEPNCTTDVKADPLDEIQTPQPATDDGNDNDSTDDNDTTVWCLVHQRSNLSIANKRPFLGTVAPLPKSLVCRYCMRSFPSLRGIHSHIHEIHKTQQHRPLHVSVKRSRSGSSINSQDLSNDSDTANVSSLYEKPLQVVFQDAYMAIVVKPQGMPVMGGKPSLLRCDLLMALVCTSEEKATILRTPMNSSTNKTSPIAVDTVDSALGKPRPVHRLDSATGGLLVVAKTHCAERTLRLAFQNRTCHKRYRAIVVGKLCPVSAAAASAAATTTQPLQQRQQQVLVTVEQNRGVIDSAVSGKQSKSIFQVVRHVPCTRHGGYLTVVDLWPVTGRKHQLRKHMKVIGHHILGDVRHCGKSKAVQAADCSNFAAAVTVNSQTPTTTSLVDTSSRLCLWAVEITVPHPISGMDVTARMTDPDWIDIVSSQEEKIYEATTCDT